MLENIIKILKDNNLLQTGILMLFGGSILGIIYKLYFKIAQLFDYLCFVKLSFESIDSLNFRRVQYWLYNLPYTKKRCTNFNIRQITKGRSNYNEDEEEDQIFYPGYGNHYLFIGGRPVILSYVKSDSKELAFRETISIKIFCIFRKAKTAEKILNKINLLYDEVEYNKTSIYACVSSYGNWQELLSKNIRQQPILSYETEYQELINDLQFFYNNEAWYFQRGINYKRGFLFKGPPGNGKTSCITAIAQYFKKHICIINLSDTDLNDKKLIELVTSLPKDSILAIEDMDKVEEKPKKGISLSTVLNILDGLLSPDQFVFFITTNYPEKLNSNLLRKGRIDITKTFDNSNGFQAKTIFNRFFPEAPAEIVQEFASKALGKSMSELENHLIINSNNILGATKIE